MVERSNEKSIRSRYAGSMALPHTDRWNIRTAFYMHRSAVVSLHQDKHTRKNTYRRCTHAPCVGRPLVTNNQQHQLQPWFYVPICKRDVKSPLDIGNHQHHTTIVIVVIAFVGCPSKTLLNLLFFVLILILILLLLLFFSLCVTVRRDYQLKQRSVAQETS